MGIIVKGKTKIDENMRYLKKKKKANLAEDKVAFVDWKEFIKFLVRRWKMNCSKHILIFINSKDTEKSYKSQKRKKFSAKEKNSLTVDYSFVTLETKSVLNHLLREKNCDSRNYRTVSIEEFR